MLNCSIYKEAIKHQKFELELDCFGSRLNTQQSKYFSYHPETFLYLIGVSSVNWGNCDCYLSAPFNVISQTLQKIRLEVAKIVPVVPKMVNLSWYNSFQEGLYQET